MSNFREKFCTLSAKKIMQTTKIFAKTDAGNILEHPNFKKLIVKTWEIIGTNESESRFMRQQCQLRATHLNCHVIS
jgi:hypothetical protein